MKTELQKIIQREKGHRKRWDIPIGQIIENGHRAPTTDPETLDNLRQIIRRNNH